MKELAQIQQALWAPKDQASPDGKLKYKFRKAEDILEKVKPIIKPDNMSIVLDDDIEEVGGRLFLKATAALLNADGVELCHSHAYAELDVNHFGMCREQMTGCASSYARKYALCGLLAIDDSKDDPDAQLSEETKILQAIPGLMTLEQINKVMELARAIKADNSTCQELKKKAVELGFVYNKETKMYESIKNE